MKSYYCDVVVVGCGAAGLSCALSALESGASVIVLERAPKEDRGGNTRWTEALLRIRDDHTVSDDFIEKYLAGSGYHTPPEFIEATTRDYHDWPSLVKAAPFLDPEVLHAFAEDVPSTLKWLMGHGIRYYQGLYPHVLPRPFYGIYGGGLALIDAMCSAVESRGGTILYETTATKLKQDEDDRVVGVRTINQDQEVIVIDARSIVLASGGFEGNLAMGVQYLGPNARFMRPVARGGWYNKGEGIRIALDIHAAPAGDYAECHRQAIDPRSNLPEALVNAYPLGILVNKSGKRFLNEAPNDMRLYQENPCIEINRQDEGTAYFIYDAQIEDVPMWRKALRTDQPPVEANSMEELAAKIDINPAVLSETIAQFNAGCLQGTFNPTTFDHLSTTGVTPEKSNWARPIKIPKFGAFPIISSNTFTFGGLKVNKDAQVMSTSGAVIRGLYAAGETMGIIYGTYVGATSVLRALVFGRRAALRATSRG